MVLLVGLLAAVVALGAVTLERSVPRGLAAAPTQGSTLADPRGRRWPDMRVDLDRASAAELTVLPGIGPRLAERIVADRADHGAFATVDDLARVRGIGPALVRRIAPYTTQGRAEAGPEAR